MRWTLLLFFVVCVLAAIARADTVEEPAKTEVAEDVKTEDDATAAATPKRVRLGARRRLFRKRLLKQLATGDDSNVTTSMSMSVSASDPPLPDSLFTKLRPKLKRMTPSAKLTKLTQLTDKWDQSSEARSAVTTRIRAYPLSKSYKFKPSSKLSTTTSTTTTPTPPTFEPAYYEFDLTAQDPEDFDPYNISGDFEEEEDSSDAENQIEDHLEVTTSTTTTTSTARPTTTKSRTTKKPKRPSKIASINKRQQYILTTSLSPSPSFSNFRASEPDPITVLPTVPSAFGRRFKPTTKKPITTAIPAGPETPNASFKPKVRPFGKRPLRKLFRHHLRTTAAPVEVPDVTTVSTPSEAASQEQTEVTRSKKTKAKDMIIIPVPPSQRKPYHPVIMQVQKDHGASSMSTTAKPQTKIVTYKLNKMFVPMGIYGKVLPKSELAEGDAETVTQVPFSGPTLSPTIKHKGTSSEELLTSDDSSGDYAAVSSSTSTSTTSKPEEPEGSFSSSQEWRTAFTKPKAGKQFADASQVDLTMNYKPDIETISLTTQRPNIDDVSLTSTQTPFMRPANKYSPMNTMTQMAPPPQRYFEKRPSSLVESIKSAVVNAASSIPGVLHGGLSQLSQFSPFDDSAATSLFHGITGGPSTPQPPSHNPFAGPQYSTIAPPKVAPSTATSAASPTASTVSVGAPDVETLEYFRKRPHLLTKGQNGFQQPGYASGFKPVTAPPHFAKAYYASTPTTPSSIADTIDSSTQTTSFFESHDKPSILSREPKNVEQGSTDDYVSQLLESSNKFKYAATASPLEKEVIQSQWSAMNEKYSQNEITAATNTIYKLISGPNPPSIDEMLYMKPPGTRQWSRSSSSAFHDMLKMFRLGFTYGTSHNHHSIGHGSSHGGPTAGPSVLHTAESSNAKSVDATAVSADEWKPIRPGGKPNSFISFSAGVSIGSTPRPGPFAIGSHFSASSKPFNPHYKKPASGSSHHHHANTFSLTEVNKDEYPPTYSHPTPNEEYGAPAYEVPQKDEYSVGTSYNAAGSSSDYPGSSYSVPSGGNTEYEQQSTFGVQDAVVQHHHHHEVQAPAVVEDTYYPASESSSDNFRFTKEKQDAESKYNYRETPENLATLYENDPSIELIPSSQYYKQKEAGIFNSGEIAAVLKPNGMTSDEVRAHLPKSALNVPQINFPDSKVPQPHVTTLNQVNQYFQSAEPSPLSQGHFQPPLYRLIQQSMASQDEQLKHHSHALNLNQPSATPQPFGVEEYRQQQQQQQHQRVSHHHRFPAAQAHRGHHQSHQAYPQPVYNQAGVAQLHHQRPQQQQQHHHHQGQQQVKTTGDGGLGFSDFELPPGVDPDIAALLKAELDKDDIPTEFRKEFEEQQKQQQASKNQQQPQQQYQQPQQQQHHQPQPQYQAPPAHHQQQHHQVQYAQASNVQPVTVQAPNRRDGTNRQGDAVATTVAAAKKDIKTVFHKPIPINPSQPARVRKPSKAVPKYVMDLAKKLKNDKNLLGIVRVTSKKEGGAPVEYLYPVRG